MSDAFGIRPGTVIGGEYEVTQLLARGGMGAVYLAKQKGTGARRALKVLHPSLWADGSLKRKFEQEARVGALIPSDHVVQVLAAGVDDATDAPWIAMEYLEGMDLAQYIAARGRLTAPETAEVVSQLCHALAAAHTAGIVHCDLKPENVFLASSRMLGRASIVKVLDFGVARMQSEVRAASRALGTPLCMAPEQGYGSPPVSPATDVWALGLLVFHALVGRNYWLTAEQHNASPATVLREVLFDPMPPASERAAVYLAADRIPAGFDAWFAKCVAREQGERFADAGAAWSALEPLLRDTTGVAPAASSLVPSVPAAPGAPSPSEHSNALARTRTDPRTAQMSAAAAEAAAAAPRRETPVRLTYRERFGKTVVEAQRGATLLEVSLAQGVPHYHECGGHARCTTCRVMVLDGEANLSPRTEAESRVAQRKGWPTSVRLACQARVLGDATVRRLVVDTGDMTAVVAEAGSNALRERTLVLMACTVRNFDAFSAENLAFDVSHVLNRLFVQVSEPVTANHGRVQTFDGNTMLAAFGLSSERSEEDCCLDALRAALRMQMRLKAFNQYLGKNYGRALELGVGLHLAPVLVGNLGPATASVPTISGEGLALVREIENLSRALRVKIAVTDAVRKRLEGRVTLGRGLPGLATRSDDTLDVFEVVDFAKPDSVFLVQSTFEQVAPRAEDFARMFYERLFELSPEVAPLFDHVDMNVQRGMLMNMLAVAVRGLDDFGPLVPTLRDLGKRHAGYGVRLQHYRAVGEALLWSLEKYFGDGFTPEVEIAWREVYATLARTMIDATRENVQTG